MSFKAAYAQSRKSGTRIPKGWSTAEQVSKDMGLSVLATLKRLRTMYSEGLVERQVIIDFSGGYGFRRPIWRVKKSK